ncbi:serine palmitoyltransferase, long chain base subunit [Perkinsus olseni]|uniref:Serine palmitoyltransferase, long chain base subunit n=1 Tax=Perkinsus olseni TaxID=32597 RepID=A0A7J6MSK8_PEROL|nr:serine palmitoyltransferase, long chain base subunit [Perkinsus olseni]
MISGPLQSPPYEAFADVDTTVYTFTVVFMIVLAVLLFLADDKRGTRPKSSMAYYTIFYPDESIPWGHFPFNDYIGGLFGLGINKETILKFVSRFVRRSPSDSSPRAEGNRSLSPRFEHEYLTWPTVLHAYWQFVVLFVKGISKEALWTVTFSKNENDTENWNTEWWKEFYTQHLYHRIEDCFNQVISSAPGSTIDVCLRDRPHDIFKRYGRLHLTGKVRRGCINLASYNYLGFGGRDDYCTPKVIEAIKEYGFASGVSSRAEVGGTNSLHVKLEAMVADYLGKEDALVMGMGFATNSMLLAAIALTSPQYADKKTLFVSDSLNHKSIVEGVKQSTAKVIGFKHNDMRDLENVLDRETRSGKWAKIIILTEGVYSMEGEFCRLREIVTLKYRYHCYLWLDEAHSIGAVGPTGRGVTELLGVDTKHVDMMMGTFTKSFGSNGGYVAGDKTLIDYLRATSTGFLHASAMTPMVASQIIAAFEVMRTPRGEEKIHAIRENSNYLRSELRKLELTVIGDIDSPVICVLLCVPETVPTFFRAALKRNLACVVVGYPAVPVLLSRARFCVSASHTREQIDYTISMMKEVAKETGICYNNSVPEEEAISYRHWLSHAPLETVELPHLSDYWKPDDLVPNCKFEVPHNGLIFPSEDTSTVSSTPVEGADRDAPLQEFAVFDPLSLIHSPPKAVTEPAFAVIDERGVGACGPRGFYGTTLEHLELEKVIKDFLETEAAILYSHHALTASSAAQAFIKKNDFVIIHKYATYGIRTGVKLSRCRNVTWWSGDIDELFDLVEAKMREVKLSSHVARVWVVMDAQFGVDLRKVVDIKDDFGAYLLLDDTYGIGTVGATGRGYCEHYGVRCSSVDILVGSLEQTFGSQGGFCVGKQTTIDHQTLYGSGYCFSASSPPASCKVATEAIKRVQGSERLARVQANTRRLRRDLEDMGADMITDAQSFAQLVRVNDAQKVASVMQERGFVVQPLLSSPLESEGLASEKNSLIRICVGAHHSPESIDQLAPVRDLTTLPPLWPCFFPFLQKPAASVPHDNRRCPSVYKGRRLNDDPIFSHLEIGYGEAIIGLGCGCVSAGVMGVLSAYTRKRCLLSGYVLLSVVLGGSLLVVAYVLASISRSDAVRFATVCGRRRKTGALYGSERMIQLMSEYESMRQALDNCIAKYGQLLRAAERRYHCGGACEAGSPLFGWPLGTGKGGVVPPESAEDLLLEPCVKGIVEDLHQQASSNATASLAAAMPLLLSGLCGSLICCSRAQKRLERIRQRGPYHLASSADPSSLPLMMFDGEDSSSDDSDDDH